MTAEQGLQPIMPLELNGIRKLTYLFLTTICYLWGALLGASFYMLGTRGTALLTMIALGLVVDILRAPQGPNGKRSLAEISASFDRARHDKGFMIRARDVTFFPATVLGVAWLVYGVLFDHLDFAANLHFGYDNAVFAPIYQVSHWIFPAVPLTDAITDPSPERLSRLSQFAYYMTLLLLFILANYAVILPDRGFSMAHWLGLDTRSAAKALYRIILRSCADLFRFVFSAGPPRQ